MGATTARMPVYLRIGNGTERPIGSVLVAPATEDAELPSEGEVAVRIVGGQLTVAELLEQVATELRRRFAEAVTGDAGATVLIASNHSEATAFAEAHPDRWTHVHVAEPSLAAVVDGQRVHSVDITSTVNQSRMAEVLHVLRCNMDKTAHSTRQVRVLVDAGDGTT